MMLLDGCIFAVLAGVYSIPIVDETQLLGFRGPPFFFVLRDMVQLHRACIMDGSIGIKHFRLIHAAGYMS